MAAAKKVSIQSVIGSTLIHNGITIKAFEVVSVDEKVAKELIELKYVKEIKVKEL